MEKRIYWDFQKDYTNPYFSNPLDKLTDNLVNRLKTIGVDYDNPHLLNSISMDYLKDRFDNPFTMPKKWTKLVFICEGGERKSTKYTFSNLDSLTEENANPWDHYIDEVLRNVKKPGVFIPSTDPKIIEETKELLNNIFEMALSDDVTKYLRLRRETYPILGLGNVEPSLVSNEENKKILDFKKFNSKFDKKLSKFVDDTKSKLHQINSEIRLGEIENPEISTILEIPSLTEDKIFITRIRKISIRNLELTEKGKSEFFDWLRKDPNICALDFVYDHSSNKCHITTLLEDSKYSQNTTWVDHHNRLPILKDALHNNWVDIEKYTQEDSLENLPTYDDIGYDRLGVDTHPENQEYFRREVRMSFEKKINEYKLANDIEEEHRPHIERNIEM